MADPEQDWQGPPPLEPDDAKRRALKAETLRQLKARVEDPRIATSVRLQFAEILDRNGVEFGLPAEQEPPNREEDYGEDQGPPHGAKPSRYIPHDETGAPIDSGFGQYHWEPQRGENEAPEAHAYRSDRVWDDAVAKAAKEQRTIARVRDLEPGVEYAAALGRAHLGGATYNLSRSATGGLADRGLGAIPGLTDVRNAAAQYGEPGVVSDAISGPNPNSPDVPGLKYTNTAASVGGTLLPGSIMGRTAGAVAKVTGAAAPNARLGANMIGGALGGAATKTVELGADTAGNALEEWRGLEPQTPTPSPMEAAFDVVMSALFGGALGVPTYYGQRLGQAMRQRTRRNNHDIVDLEAAGGSTDTVRGVRPPPAVDAAENLAARQPRTAGEPVTIPGTPAMPGTPAVPPRDIADRSLLGTPAEDITAQRAARKGARALSNYRSAVPERIENDVNAYGMSPEGQVDHPVQEAWDAANEVLRNARDSAGRPLPLATIRAYQRHLGGLSRGEFIPAGSAGPDDVVVSVRDARRMGVLTDQHGRDLSQMAAQAADALPYQRLDPGERALAGSRRIDTANIANDPASTVGAERQRQVLPMRTILDDAQRDLEASGLEVRLTPRTMDFREMERSIRNFQNEISNLAGNARNSQAEDRILQAMTTMRERFGPNATAPQGAAVMRQGHARDMAELEDTLGALGLPRRMDRVDPNDQQVIGAMLNAARRWREGGAEGPVLRERLERLMRSDPEYEAAMRNVAAHYAYKRLDESEDLRRSGLSNRGIVTTLIDAIARRADPSFGWLSGETPPAPRTPPLGTAIAEQQRSWPLRFAEPLVTSAPVTSVMRAVRRATEFDARGRGAGAARAARVAPEAADQERERRKKVAIDEERARREKKAADEERERRKKKTGTAVSGER